MAAAIGAYHMALDFTHITPFTEFSFMQLLEAAGFAPERMVFQCQAPACFGRCAHGIAHFFEY
nr:hypothetical protein [Desulfosoma caldarium]